MIDEWSLIYKFNNVNFVFNINYGLWVYLNFYMVILLESFSKFSIFKSYIIMIKVV